jgi:hypothetical protein
MTARHDLFTLRRDEKFPRSTRFWNYNVSRERAPPIFYLDTNCLNQAPAVLPTATYSSWVCPKIGMGTVQNRKFLFQRKSNACHYDRSHPLYRVILVHTILCICLKKMSTCVGRSRKVISSKKKFSNWPRRSLPGSVVCTGSECRLELAEIQHTK